MQRLHCGEFATFVAGEFASLRIAVNSRFMTQLTDEWFFQQILRGLKSHNFRWELHLRGIDWEHCDDKVKNMSVRVCVVRCLRLEYNNDNEVVLVNTIYTIGYQGVNIEEFIKYLKNNKIEVLADVRQRPYSRKAGFSKQALNIKLSEVGIAYKHFEALGCPVQIRDQYKVDANWSAYCESYNKFLVNESIILESLASFIKSFPCAIFCFEANANFCHRSLIAKSIALMHPELTINNLSFEKQPKKETPVQLRLCWS